MNDFKAVTLNNGNILAFFERDCEVIIYPNGDYICSVNHCLSFTRPSHNYIIKKLRPKGRNVTMAVYYNKYN